LMTSAVIAVFSDFIRNFYFLTWRGSSGDSHLPYGFLGPTVEARRVAIGVGFGFSVGAWAFRPTNQIAYI